MKQILEDIKTEKFKQLYLLYGEEDYLRQQYKEKLLHALSKEGDQMNVHIYEGKDVSIPKLIDLSETLPFLAERRVIFLKDSGLFKSGGEQLSEYLGEIAPTSVFVFEEKEIDKRSKLYKIVQSKGYVAEFQVQDEKMLVRWIGTLLKKEKKQITENTAYYFLNKVGTDMENIRTELEKVISYAIERDVITKEDIDTVCVSKITNHIFDMVSSIAMKERQRAVQLYHDLLVLKEPPMRILFLITRQYQTLLSIKDLKRKGCDNRTIGEKIGMANFIVNKYLSQAASFKFEEIRDALSVCVETEEAVKTGKMVDQMSVELLIVTLCQSEAH